MHQKLKMNIQRKQHDLSDDDVLLVSSTKSRLTVNPSRPFRSIESRIDDVISKSFKIAPETPAELARNHTQRDIDSLDDIVDFEDFLNDCQGSCDEPTSSKSKEKSVSCSKKSKISESNEKRAADNQRKKTKSRKKSSSRTKPIPITVAKKRKIVIPKHFQEKLYSIRTISKNYVVSYRTQ